MKFRKKPVVIDAIQLTKENIKEVYELVYKEKVLTNSYQSLDYWETYTNLVIRNGMEIPTLEDGNDNQVKHIASIGDWIITGVKGEFYPVKPDIFELTYEKVEE